MGRGIMSEDYSAHPTIFMVLLAPVLFLIHMVGQMDPPLKLYFREDWIGLSLEIALGLLMLVLVYFYAAEHWRVFLKGWTWINRMACGFVAVLLSGLLLGVMVFTSWANSAVLAVFAMLAVIFGPLIVHYLKRWM